MSLIAVEKTRLVLGRVADFAKVALATTAERVLWALPSWFLVP